MRDGVFLDAILVQAPQLNALMSGVLMANLHGSKWLYINAYLFYVCEKLKQPAIKTSAMFGERSQLVCHSNAEVHQPLR